MKKCRLSDCCLSISDGDHLAPPKADEGIPFITIRNFDAYNDIDFSESMSVPEDYYDSLKNIRKPQKSDILYSVVGSFGIPVLIKNDKKFVFQRHIAILRPNPKKVDTNYLFQLMRSESFYAVADILAIGSAQRTISLTSLRRILIELPDLKVQQKIGRILSQYDELIAINRKKIQVLEEMAMRTYREWFVHMRFPGYETTPKENGLPQGWEYDEAQAFYKISIGKTPPRGESQWFSTPGDGVPWLSISDMSNTIYTLTTSETLTEDAIQYNRIIMVPKDTILLSFKLTVGRVCIAPFDICTNEAIAHFQLQDKELKEYTYCFLKCFNYQSLGSTSSLAIAVNSKIIKRMPFVMPTMSILKQFHKISKPLFEDILYCQQQIDNLQKMRDKLLPQLMSGKLEIKA